MGCRLLVKITNNKQFVIGAYDHHGADDSKEMKEKSVKAKEAIEKLETKNPITLKKVLDNVFDTNEDGEDIIEKESQYDEMSDPVIIEGFIEIDIRGDGEIVIERCGK